VGGHNSPSIRLLSQRRALSLTRKALVGHYFAAGAFVYHDLSAGSSRQQYFGGCLVR
jgi:hypothetical protein